VEPESLLPPAQSPSAAEAAVEPESLSPPAQSPSAAGAALEPAPQSPPLVWWRVQIRRMAVLAGDFLGREVDARVAAWTWWAADESSDKEWSGR
jgi:hypothetical protein